MAISLVKDFYSETDPCVLTVPAGGIPIGDLIVVASAWDSETVTFTSVTDNSNNAGTANSYSLATEVHGTAGTTRSNALAYCAVTRSLDAGDSITVTISSSSPAAIAAQFTGITDTSPLDKTTGQNQNAVTTVTSGLTATTTQADELCVGTHFAVATTAWTADGSYTVNENQSPFGIYRMVMQYKIVSATGTYESNGTTTSQGWCSIIGTFKASGPPPVDTGLAWIKA